MFRPLSLYIGLRYTRSKKRSGFVSFISLMSMIGIALGVMVLITVLSVMNGFDQQIRAKLFTLVPQVTVQNQMGKLTSWQSLMQTIAKNPEVTAITPIVGGQALLNKDGQTTPAVVNGILATKDQHVMDIQNHMIAGSLEALNTTPFGVILGEGVAVNLGVIVGDTVDLVTPAALVTPVGIIPRYKQCKVVGIFSTHSGFGFDEAYVFMALKDAQTLYMMGDSVTALNIRLKNLFSAPQVAWQLEKTLGDEYNISDWTEQFGAFYHAVHMEKTIMFFILLLIIAIASFNLVSSLMMGVNDKSADIAILRTYGVTPGSIMRIFIIQGGLIGIIGTFIGVVLGVLLSLNITAIVNHIQAWFGVQLLNPNVYYVDFLPSQLQWQDIVLVSLISMAMSLIATIYPAWRASKIQPAEALRYE